MPEKFKIQIPLPFAARRRRAQLEARIEAQLPALTRLARGLIRNPADAEDLVHDTCVKALAAAEASEFESGEAITTVVGYRVGRTRGAVDTSGVRTQFSNHAYGIALDINPERNGLYDNCIEFNQSCRLIRGGEWQPGRQGSITRDSPIVSALENIGMKWGGEIPGQQKDFMHFSPSGY